MTQLSWASVLRHRWSRRALTVPAVGLLWLTIVAMAPLWLPLAFVVDAVRRTRLSTVRFGALIVLYFTLEVVGVAAAGTLWLRSAFDRTAGQAARAQARHFRLQNWWATALFRGISTLYQFHVTVEAEGHAADPPAPMLVLVRHAGMVDTLLPASFLADTYGIRLRYVLSHHRLLDPCLDIVGNRLPNYFIPHPATTETKLAGVVGLAQDMGDHDGVLIFPEGRRYTPRSRARAIASLEGTHPALAARAREFQHTLAPRHAGVLGLLDAAPNAQVVVVNHRGFERVHHFKDLLSGALVGTHVHVSIRWIDRADVPDGDADRIDWLYQEWERLDAWLGSHTQAAESQAADGRDRPADVHAGKV